MIQKINDSVYAFPGRRFDCHSYLLLEDVPILIDPGTGFFFSELANDLARVGFPPNKISAIINTHCHFDHAGADHFFQCRVYARSPDREAISTGDPETTLAKMFNTEFKPVDAKELPCEFHGWEIINTPGHTPGSISLYNKEKRILISGDTLFPYGVGRTDLPGGNKDALTQSLGKLRNLKFDILLSGHGIRFFK